MYTIFWITHKSSGKLKRNRKKAHRKIFNFISFDFFFIFFSSFMLSKKIDAKSRNLLRMVWECVWAVRWVRRWKYVKMQIIYKKKIVSCVYAVNWSVLTWWRLNFHSVSIYFHFLFKRNTHTRSQQFTVVHRLWRLAYVKMCAAAAPNHKKNFVSRTIHKRKHDDQNPKRQ